MSWTRDWPVFAGLAERAQREIPLPEGTGVEYAGEPAVLGGAPGCTPNPDLEILGWGPPAWLERLYAVHGGLGPWWGLSADGRPDRWTRYAILPWDAVTPLTRHIRFGEEDITFDPADCVLFVRDGLGGGWVLEGRDQPRIRRFDGQRHTLSEPVDRDVALAWIVDCWIPERA